MSVSIVMPNYNNGRTIEQTLRSLRNDPVVSEIVIYDNASTDRSPDLIERVGDDRIRLVRGDKNLGATLGRHAAIEHSTNDLICFLDGDDFLGPSAVGLAYEELQRQRLDIALFRMINVNAEGEEPRPFLVPSEDVIDGRTACAMT